MNLEAAIFMFCAWAFTFGLLAFCIYKLVKSPDQNFNNSEFIDDE